MVMFVSLFKRRACMVFGLETTSTFLYFSIRYLQEAPEIQQKRFVLKCFLQDVDGITSIYSSYVACNISKTSASVSSGVPNTEKQMTARGRRPTAFIVSTCLKPLMRHEARVFGIAS